MSEFDNFKKQMFNFFPYFRSIVMRASAVLKYMQLQKEIWTGCVHLKNTKKATK